MAGFGWPQKPTKRSDENGNVGDMCLIYFGRFPTCFNLCSQKIRRKKLMEKSEPRKKIR
jgi:hypothetical protein